MALAGRHNLTIEQGVTFRRIFHLKDEDGALLDLTGATAILQGKQSKSTEIVINLSIGNGITMGGVAGTITVEMSPEETELLTILDLVYDMKVDYGVDKERLIQGKITLDTEVSK